MYMQGCKAKFLCACNEITWRSSRQTSPCTLGKCKSWKWDKPRHDIPGTVHLPFLTIVSTTSTIRGWALATSSVYQAPNGQDGGKGGEGEEKWSTTNCELLKRTRVLDIGKGFVKLLELNINFLLRLLCLGDLKTNAFNKPQMQGEKTGTTNSLDLKRLNGLDVRAHIIRRRLEVFQQLFRLIHNGFILQHRTVVRKVDGGGLGRNGVGNSLRLEVAFTECLQWSNGFYNEMKKVASWKEESKRTLSESKGGINTREIL